MLKFDNYFLKTIIFFLQFLFKNISFIRTIETKKENVKRRPLQGHKFSSN